MHHRHHTAGALLLGRIFSMLKFENGLGWINLSAYWQSDIRDIILLGVAILQAKHLERRLRSAAGAKQ